MTGPGARYETEMDRVPTVSVVTPFYNTAEFLAECIESVLAQSFGDFEYLLVNNHSTDGSRDIAARYAARDSRIRLLDNAEFVGQIENYNGALTMVHPGCRFVKMVQADDAIFPECLAAMVEVANAHPQVGFVSSYHLRGEHPLGGGLPRGVEVCGGREVVRRLLMQGFYPFASPSSVLYRAELVRRRVPFFAVGHLHDDTEAHVELLLEHDLGFVHQVLSFLRTQEGSIMSNARRFNPEELDHLILLERYGAEVLSPEELAHQRDWEWRRYLGILGEARLLGRGKEFWAYHRRGLATIGRELPERELALPALKQLTRWTLSPLDWPQRLRTRRALRGN